MSDLSQLSNEELTSLYRQSQAPDIQSMVTSEAQRQGVDPSLALAVARKESGFRANAVSPKGALGPMQLMPATARELGVDPNDPAQNVQGGVAYLKRQLDRFGDPKLALAAYNAGPGAVQKYGGVPPYAETQHYVQDIAGGSGGGDLSNVSDDELKALYAGSQPPAQQPHEVAASHNGGVTMELGGPADGEGWSAPEARTSASVLGDAAEGFAQPFVQFGHDVADNYRRTTAQAAKPNPGGDLSSLMDIPRIAGDVANLAGAPLQAGVNAAAGLISRNLPAPKATHTDWRGIIPHMYVDGDMTPEQAKAEVASGLNTALQGARPAGVGLPAARAASVAQTPVAGANLTQQVRAVSPQMPVPLPKQTIPATVQRLLGEKRAAYAKVDGSGFRFSNSDVGQLASDLDAQLRAHGGPKAAKASPQADSIIGRIKALAGQNGGVTLTQLDKVRSDIGPLMMDGGGSDAFYGRVIRRGIDDLMSRTQAPYIQEARAANTRWLKADDVSRRVRSAELSAGRANSGENLGNTIRQKLSPMIDPMHSGEVTNLSPAEASAIEKIVVGDKTQNKLRTWGNRLRNPINIAGSTPTGALIGTLLGGPAGGVLGSSVGLAQLAAGQALRGAAEKRTMANVEDLIKLIAGGQGRPKVPVVTPRGLIGGSALAAPIARQPSRRQSEQNKSR